MTVTRDEQPDDGLDLNDPVRRAQFEGHLELMKVAWQFLETAVRDGDLHSVWHLVDEPLRAQLAQQWVTDNSASIMATGYDKTAVATALTVEAPTHPLWVHFERVHVRGLRQVLPDSSAWGIGANTRVVGPDLEALYVHDTTQLPPDGIWRPGEASGYVYPLVFRRAEDRWLLTRLGANELTDDLG